MLERPEGCYEAVVHSSVSPASGIVDGFRKAEASTQERWLPVVGAGGKYEVSDSGRVRRGTRILIDRGQPKGYRVVDISVDGKALTRTVHRLVAEAFHGPAGGRQVNHKNGIKHENAAGNLEWVSARANTRHAIALGLHKSTRRELGRFIPRKPVDPLALATAILNAAEVSR